MTKEEDFKLLKIQTCALKVSIHCDGCKQKVKKILQRIEGVYQVNIDADQQKVTVSGTVDYATLIKKLVRAGKHAEVWSQKSGQNQELKNNSNCIKYEKNNGKGQKQGAIKGIQAFKNQQKIPAFSSEDDDDDDDYDEDEDEDDYEDELRFLRHGQLGVLRQQAVGTNNGKRNAGAMAAASNIGDKMTNNLSSGGNGGKKGNPNHNVGVKVNSSGGGGGIDPKTLAALKMNNAQVGGGGNINVGEGKRGNDLSAMMNLAGFHGNGGSNMAGSAAAVAALGGNPNSLAGFQVQSSNNGYRGSSSSSGFPGSGYATGQHPSSMLTNMNGYNHPASMMMNMQNRNVMQQQPQMMYNMSPFIPPTTGYYCNNYNTPASSYLPYPDQHNYSIDYSTAATTHMFSDENTSTSCSIM